MLQQLAGKRFNVAHNRIQGDMGHIIREANENKFHPNKTNREDSPVLSKAEKLLVTPRRNISLPTRMYNLSVMVPFRATHTHDLSFHVAPCNFPWVYLPATSQTNHA
jgi:hypothetical protein